MWMREYHYEYALQHIQVTEVKRMRLDVCIFSHYPNLQTSYPWLYSCISKSKCLLPILENFYIRDYYRKPYSSNLSSQSRKMRPRALPKAMAKSWINTWISASSSVPFPSHQLTATSGTCDTYETSSSSIDCT